MTLRTLWHPRRIAWRVSLGFGLIVLVLLAALVKANLHIHLVTRLTETFATNDLPRLLRVQALSLQTESIGGALARLMYAPRESRVEEYAQVDALNRSIDGIVEGLAAIDDPQERAALAQLRQARQAYAEAFIATADELEADNLEAAVRVLNQRVRPALKTMLQASNLLLDQERGRLEGALADARTVFAQVAWWLIGLSVLAIALAVWLAYRTTRGVVEPLGVLEQAARRIARGDYGARVPPTQAEEADRVGQALNAMVDAVIDREAEITRLAHTDTLTGLPNRAALLAEPCPVPGGVHGVAMLDLARLKVVNETLGYVTGNSLIQAAALRVQEQIASSAGMAGAVAVRVGGGTLAVAWPQSASAVVQDWWERLTEAMAAPVHCSGHRVDANLSAGLADGRDGAQASVETLLRNAEVALNAAKRGKLDHLWYDPGLEAARLGHVSLISDLRQAVSESQLQMWLQPKFDLHSGRAVGAEALVRWRHPQRGFVSPAEFVPFAEQTGYIGMLTRWMVEQALLTLARWSQHHADLYIAVNISTHDLRSAEFRSVVAALLERHGVASSRLRLEVVESGLMDDPQTCIAELRALRAMGLDLSIDDFGTGYSSLAYLQQLPVSELKIDRSFVQDIDTSPMGQRLFKAMVEMGKGMGLSITAEGVETEAERATIVALGCEVMQGYLGSKPLHGEALHAWLKAQRGALDLSL
ncbi:EAL domain-containing protein [Curvibacter sp. APW13]|uniref:putative bifunctional diguanylate cyclase/phosphodiesterase n=1 Tax=Curvibacter sp. APW13 TaxID=3077236 RepID=UPI0028DF9FF7|nr:EAL domain-containing protein [Curvibacter sp. APW13]MDT8990408.1 EAL domain-containing protein [Curvibacter sp. APW13]